MNTFTGFTAYSIERESAFLERAAQAAQPHAFSALRASTVADKMPALDHSIAETDVLLQLAQRIADAGGRAFIVGGFVRDALLGLPSKDYDVEVFGLDVNGLKDILATAGTVDCVGEQFGVLMIHGYDIDWSLPRQDSKSGRGHRGIDVHCDPGLSFVEAARRRDLTINALMWDPLQDELIDPYNGIADLKSGILRAVDEALFSDDPLRGLRAVRMASVFGFLPDERLLQLMSQQDLSELSAERLWGEWEKIALKSRLPSLAFMCLEDSGLIQYFPELDALRDVQQDPHWHPEGDVYVHTAMVCDAATALRNGEREHDLALFFGALCHDLGKAPTTVFEDERWRSKAHDVAGIPLCESFLHFIHSPHQLITQVCALTEHHLKPVSYQKGNAGPGAYRRLSRKCVDAHVDLQLLCEVCEADHRGRTTDDATSPSIDYIDAFYAQIEDMALAHEAPQPAVLGRHLLERGFTPGPEIGKVLQQCFDYQLETGNENVAEILSFILDGEDK